MFSAIDDSLFVMPICYHPTTVLSVDDDIDFLKNLSLRVSDKLVFLSFDNPTKALEYTKNQLDHLPFTSRCLIEINGETTFDLFSVRNEIYNKSRFDEIIINVTDYDMPYKDGVSLVKSMEFPEEISQYSHIFLTGKFSDDFKDKLAKIGLSTEYIGKEDPDFVNKLIALIEKRSAMIFQRYSYAPARILSKNKNEMVSILFDGNFAPIFNAYIKDNNICELYLFDKQGSFLFLDADAHLSWFFVRNECGIENSIQLAEHFGAPNYIIKALKEKKVILSLYEKEDFIKRERLNWDDYLCPATVFESNDKYSRFFLNHDTNPLNPKNDFRKYYYAFTHNFPNHGIDTKKIFSYQQFLDQ